MTCFLFRNPSVMFFAVTLLALAFFVACGQAATPTPVPSPTSPTTSVQPQSTPTLAPPPPHEGRTPIAQATPVSTPTLAAQAGAPVATRVRIGTASAGGNETNRTWAGSRQAYVQFNPMLDNLIGLDPETGLRVPELAERWEGNSDLSVWTFYLRKGVQFHNDWGEFTARDVPYNIERLCRPDTRLSTCGFLSGPNRDVPIDQIVEIVNDYTVKITSHGRDGKPVPLSFMPFVWGNDSSELAIESSAHFQARGIEGLDQDGPQGTGPYQYMGRRPAQSITLERKSEEDWMGREPDFQEVEILWVPEDASRYAAMQAGEIDVADLPLDLQKDAEQRGLKLIRSRFTANNLSVFFGGMFFTSDPRDREHFDPTVPWVDVKVRKAMNLAVNREELLDFLYKGIGEMMYVDNFHPNLEGWDPTFPQRYETDYKYNPDEAMRLLAEAGYGPDNPLRLKAMSYASPGEAETPQVMEAVCTLYWARVGIQCELVDLDLANVSQKWQSFDTAGWVWPNIIIFFPVEYYLGVGYSVHGVVHHYEDDWIEEKLAELRVTGDPQARDGLAREIGNYMFENYVNIPLFWFRHTVVADPEVVADWVFPGNAVPRASHMHLLKAVKR